MSVTGGILAGVGLAGSIGSAAIGSSAATSAASTQAGASDQAAQLQYQASQNALQFQEGEYGQSESNLAPWLQSGEGALANLDYLTGVNPPTTQGATAGSPGAFSPTTTTGAFTPVSTSGIPASSTNLGQGAQPIGFGTSTPTGGAITPGSATTNLSALVNPSLGAEGSLLSAYPGGPFVAPTAAQALQSPGEQAQLQLGEQALQQSAAAQGNLLTGGTAEALDAYGQNLASTNYQNTYNQAYNTYAANYNQFENQQTNTYNRLAALSGVGQTTASNLGTLGTSAASGVSSNLLNTAAQIGQDTQNAGAANASGIVGSANAITGALGSTTSNLTNLALLNQLYGNGASGDGVPTNISQGITDMAD